jgi:hypothetical protein
MLPARRTSTGRQALAHGTQSVTSIAVNQASQGTDERLGHSDGLPFAF